MFKLCQLISCKALLTVLICCLWLFVNWCDIPVCEMFIKLIVLLWHLILASVNSKGWTYLSDNLFHVYVFICMFIITSLKYFCLYHYSFCYRSSKLNKLLNIKVCVWFTKCRVTWCWLYCGTLNSGGNQWIQFLSRFCTVNHLFSWISLPINGPVWLGDILV